MTTDVVRPTVACYTFPHFHRSAYNDRVFGSGWTEYNLARGGRPWFEGHHQPRTPAYGELDEADPDTWRVYGKLAVEGGIDVFIWDCYWYDGQPALHEALESGFLRAELPETLRFAVMWVNHPWYKMFPTTGHPPADHSQGLFGTAGLGAREKLDDLPQSVEGLFQSLAYLVCRYLTNPKYWSLDDRPFLAVWDAEQVIEAHGIEGCRALLSDVRLFGKKLGLPDIHFHATQGGIAAFDRIDDAGFDSYGIYNPIYLAAAARPDHEELVDYETAVDDTITRLWPDLDRESRLPFFPAIGPGWDSTPRCLEPPKQSGSRQRWPGGDVVVVGDSPKLFGRLAEAALEFVSGRQPAESVVTVGCWNEWTEGQYLLPDTKHGSGMLNALASARSPSPTA